MSASATAEEGFEERLTRFLRSHAPDRIAHVPSYLEKYSGREEALMKTLVQKYGPEQPAVGGSAPTKTRAAAAPASSPSKTKAPVAATHSVSSAKKPERNELAGDSKIQPPAGAANMQRREAHAMPTEGKGKRANPAAIAKGISADRSGSGSPAPRSGALVSETKSKTVVAGKGKLLKPSRGNSAPREEEAVATSEMASRSKSARTGNAAVEASVPASAVLAPRGRTPHDINLEALELTLKEVLVAHAPERIGQAEGLAKRYVDDRASLFTLLCKRYGLSEDEPERVRTSFHNALLRGLEMSLEAGHRSDPVAFWDAQVRQISVRSERLAAFSAEIDQFLTVNCPAKRHLAHDLAAANLDREAVLKQALSDVYGTPFDAASASSSPVPHTHTPRSDDGSRFANVAELPPISSPSSLIFSPVREPTDSEVPALSKKPGMLREMSDVARRLLTAAKDLAMFYGYAPHFVDRIYAEFQRSPVLLRRRHSASRLEAVNSPSNALGGSSRAQPDDSMHETDLEDDMDGERLARLVLLEVLMCVFPEACFSVFQDEQQRLAFLAKRLAHFFAYHDPHFAGSVCELLTQYRGAREGKFDAQHAIGDVLLRYYGPLVQSLDVLGFEWEAVQSAVDTAASGGDAPAIDSFEQGGSEALPARRRQVQELVALWANAYGHTEFEHAGSHRRFAQLLPDTSRSTPWPPMLADQGVDTIELNAEAEVREKEQAARQQVERQTGLCEIGVETEVRPNFDELYAMEQLALVQSAYHQRTARAFGTVPRGVILPHRRDPSQFVTPRPEIFLETDGCPRCALLQAQLNHANKCVEHVRHAQITEGYLRAYAAQEEKHLANSSSHCYARTTVERNQVAPSESGVAPPGDPNTRREVHMLRSRLNEAYENQRRFHDQGRIRELLDGVGPLQTQVFGPNNLLLPKQGRGGSPYAAVCAAQDPPSVATMTTLTGVQLDGLQQLLLLESL